MVNKLTDQKFGIEFEQLLHTVLKDNKYCKTFGW